MCAMKTVFSHSFSRRMQTSSGGSSSGRSSSGADQAAWVKKACRKNKRRKHFTLRLHDPIPALLWIQQCLWVSISPHMTLKVHSDTHLRIDMKFDEFSFPIIYVDANILVKKFICILRNLSLSMLSKKTLQAMRKFDM